MSANASDLLLWDRVRNDSDTNAFNQIFDRYWSKIFSTAFNRLRDRETCIEITNDIFVMLWTKRERLEIHSFQNYLQAATRYHVYRHVKQIKAAPFDYSDNLENVAIKNYTINSDYNLQYAELERTVDYYLSQLPQRCREIFVLSRKDQLSNDEIANRLTISKRTVENQITSALKHLRVPLKNIFGLLFLLAFCTF
jgi:RNA polymerase sigma-70 factor (ECF subfamily)